MDQPEQQMAQPPGDSTGEPDSAFAALLDQMVKCISSDPAAVLKLLEPAAEAYAASGDAILRGRYCQMRAQAHTMLSQYTNAEKWAAEAVPCFRDIGFSRGIAAIFNIRGIIASNQSHYADAIQFHREALRLCQEIDLPAGVGHSATNLALDYSYMGDYTQALAYHTISLEAWRSTNDSAGLANALINIGFLFTKLERHEEALDNFHEADRLFEQQGLTRNRILVWRNIGTSMAAIGKLEAASEYAGRALAEARMHNDSGNLAKALDGHAEVLQANGRSEEARAALLEAVQLYQQDNNSRGVVLARIQLAELLDAGHPQALQLLRDAWILAETNALKAELAEIHAKLARHHHAAADYLSAFTHLQEHHRLNRELQAQQTAERAKALQISHAYEKALRDAEIERLRNVELAAALQEAESQRAVAEELSRQMAFILQIAAHDLRNLAGNIVSTAALALELASEEAFGSDLLELLQATDSRAAILQETLDHILDAAAIEQGRIQLNADAFDLCDLIESCVNDWRETAVAKQQNIRLQRPDSCRVLLDRVRVREILDNLISNAVKYAPPATAIDLLLEGCGEKISFAVKDRGPGIDEEDVVKLFRMFQRLKPKPTAGETSIGIGLYIVQMLASLQGGRIDYRRRISGGSCFTLSLPRNGSSADCSD